MNGLKKKKILKEKKKIYSYFKKRIKNFKVFYQKGNFVYKYPIFINKFNSKYVMMIGDDDRIIVKNFIKIIKYLNFNFSGITFDSENFKVNQELENKSVSSLNKIRSFNLYEDLNKIGFISNQIIKKDLINKIFNQEKKYLQSSAFPQNFIITKIIKTFNNWKVSNLKCIYLHMESYSPSIHSKQTLARRLVSEYKGYLVPLKKNYPDLNRNQLSKIYINIFFRNIMSWVFLSFKYLGKKKTFKNIKKVRKIIHEPIIIKLVLFFFKIIPISILNFIKVIRRFILGI